MAHSQRSAAVAAAATCLLAFGVGCADQASTPKSPAAKSAAAQPAAYAPTIDPVEFSTKIDNPYFPLVPGTRFVYEGKTDEGNERIVVEVTREERTVMGVKTVVVRDTVTLEGELVEDTKDWYAQHKDGTVWYFGEQTAEYENGKVVNTKGAWEAGVDGAQPGIVMMAKPKVGETYRQEYYRGEAEDQADVISLTGTATVPAGSYQNVLKTLDYTPLDTNLVENKYYAPGVGFVLEVGVKGGTDRIGLVRIERF